MPGKRVCCSVLKWTHVSIATAHTFEVNKYSVGIAFIVICFYGSVVCVCVVGHFLFVAVVIKCQLEQLHQEMEQNAEERKNMLNYIYFTKIVNVNVSELLNF